MTDTRKTPTLTQVLEQTVQGGLRGVRTWLPGRIEAYDASTRRATVQVLPADGYIDEDGERVAEIVAPLTDVPVAFVGSGAVRVKMPVRVGDQCVVLFASSSIARLKATGRVEPYDPGDDRRHRLADAIAIPLVMVGDDVESETFIEFTAAGLVEIGGPSPLVTRDEFLNHTHATAGAGTPSPPILGAAPGSSVTFPGTSKLRG